MKTQTIKYIIPALIIPLIGYFFFFQSDEAYLKKKTIKLIKMVDSHYIQNTHMAILKKVSEAVKYIHPSVRYTFDLDDRFYENHSLEELRALMFTYFKQSKKVKIDTLSERDIHISISETENKKAEVSFPINAVQEHKKLSCKAVLVWVHEKKWLIHEITVSRCSVI